ncbi:uncharacterized protein BP5553_02743 [Venustampulla echinocandica]|uniref:Zn(2)-C6 fungal-type domain-containing protein n=1 Tax=Venustampulla echinocandica TaxID=2656787 RepID=A0A370TSB9_9HELO|nr:uncharacterized protein BP5553_02743 [Venustampulla echinocandica]RDL38403.1 hypothetical protein BP5553_02743 [Venustampulla echinocandica]
MPGRRSHKKSKAGCQRCKQRKIKCDEVHPTCGNCSKHGVSCDFESGASNAGTPTSHPSPAPRSHRPSIASSTGGTPSSSSSRSAVATLPLYQTPSDFIRADVNPASSRLLELRLMHHFTAQTSQTFSDIGEARNAWQVDIPTIAYGAQHLMDAILAVSALHLRALHPNDQTLVRASHGYMASALAQYSSLLTQGLSELNAEALFSTSALIAFQASASRRFEDLDRGYSLPLAWFHSFQGVKTVVMASWQWLRKSDRVFPIINSQHALSLNLDPQRRLFFAPILEGLDEQLCSLPENLVVETRQAYEHAVAFLNWAHQTPIRNRILGFAATVSRRFVELMAQKDPRALVIVACFFALTRIVDDVWWLQGVAKREVNGIFGMLPREWLPKMEWPLKIANHEGIIDGELWGEPLNRLKMEQDLNYDNVFNHIDILTRVLETCTPPQMPPD